MFGMLSCKEATMLASKKEEGKITLMERLKLAIHYAMCIYCKRFAQHTRIIAGKAGQTASDMKMPEPAKTSVKNTLKSL